MQMVRMDERTDRQTDRVTHTHTHTHIYIYNHREIGREEGSELTRKFTPITLNSNDFRGDTVSDGLIEASTS